MSVCLSVGNDALTVPVQTLQSLLDIPNAALCCEEFRCDVAAPVLFTVLHMSTLGMVANQVKLHTGLYNKKFITPTQ